MAQRMARILGIFTGHGDDIDNLLGTKQGGTTRPRRIGQDLFQVLLEAPLLFLRFDRFEPVGGGEPALAPDTHLLPVEA